LLGWLRRLLLGLDLGLSLNSRRMNLRIVALHGSGDANARTGQICVAHGLKKKCCYPFPAGKKKEDFLCVGLDFVLVVVKS
jgi:hypothetical protein